MLTQKLVKNFFWKTSKNWFFNPKNDAFTQSEEFKLNAVVKFMDDVLEDLMNIYREILSEATKTL